MQQQIPPQAPVEPAGAAQPQPQAQGQGSRPVGRYGPQNDAEWAKAEDVVNKISEQMYDDVAANLKDSEDPIEAAGEMAGRLIFGAERDMEEKGVMVPDSVAEGAYKLMVEDFVEMAHGIGVVDFQSQDEVNEALLMAARVAGKTYAEAVMSERDGGQQMAGQAQQMPEA